MRAPLISALALALIAGCSQPLPSSAVAEPEIVKVIDDWHDAAATADEERYFRHFAPGGVFLGTDATERWDVDGFRKYAHPHFARGKAWAFKSTRRAITVDAGGAVAWFDEDLATTNLGPCRGSGVLVREGGRGAWKIAQYNLAVTVPNDRFPEVKKILEAADAPPR
jgi:ketosteroid isomerase-like protein